MAITKKSILFIINPHSGNRGKDHIPGLLKAHLDQRVYDWEMVYTQYAGHATKISEAGKSTYDVIVAIGGDGTINEVARPLVNTKTTLGIIPCGSGNGLARHLKIPRNARRAIELLNRQHTLLIDSINLEDDVFFNVAGVGFDAHIAQLFAISKKRGFFSYAWLAFSEIRKFKSIDYHLQIDGEEKIENAPFLISIANSTQYGNNAHIAPGAHISDGLMDICVLRNFPFWYYPTLLYRLFTSSLIHSRYYQCWQGKEATIKFINYIETKSIHLDGDPYTLKNGLRLTVNPKSLHVICGR